jgi:hypothetical protein
LQSTDVTMTKLTASKSDDIRRYVNQSQQQQNKHCHSASFHIETLTFTKKSTTSLIHAQQREQERPPNEHNPPIPLLCDPRQSLTSQCMPAVTMYRLVLSLGRHSIGIGFTHHCLWIFSHIETFRFSYQIKQKSFRLEVIW